MLDRRTVLKGVGCSRGAEEDREGGDGCFERYGAEGCGLCDSGMDFGSCGEAWTGARETLAWLRRVEGWIEGIEN